MERTLRVAIVGAGVAGSYLAAMLATMRGVEVDIYEPRWGEYRKPCGEAVSAEAREHIPPSTVKTAVYGGAIVDPLGYVVVRRWPYPVGFIIDKEALVMHNRRFAREAGATVVQRHANPADLVNDYDIVVDARGPFSDAPEYDAIIAARAYTRRKPEHFYGDDIIIMVFDWFMGYAWAFPAKSEGMYNVGVGWRSAEHSRVCTGMNGLQCFAAKMNALLYGEEVVKPSDISTAKIKVVDPRHAIPKEYNGRLVRIGEAGGFVVPFTGEGIRPALESAEAAAEDINEMIANGWAKPKWTRLRRLTRLYKRHHMVYRIAVRLGPEVSVRMLMRMEHGDMLAFLRGDISVWRLARLLI